MSGLLRVLVVDDEPLAVERMRIVLSRCDAVEVVGTADNGPAALDLARTLSPDACFLDIGMPQMDGIAVARGLAGVPQPPRIVFVTAYDSFAVTAFDVDAVDYIVKPVDPERLARALARVRQHVGPAQPAPAPTEHLTEFWASAAHGLTRIAARDIDRITAERDYMRLHVGKRSWLVNDSLSRLEQQLDPEMFVRLHRSAIVRRGFIAGLRYDDNRWIATLTDGNEQKIGRLYADAARQLLGRRASRRP